MRFESVLFVIFSLILVGCDEIEDRIVGSADQEVTIEEAEAQNYDLITPEYGIRVAVNQSVDMPDADTVAFLDSKIMDFLNCQFAEGAQLGFENYELPSGRIVPPLSELRIYIVPKTFECNATDRDICSGIYFNDEDIIVLAEKSLGRCEDLALTQHEVAHRYGLNSNHSNQAQYSECSDPRQCDLGDLIREDNLSSDHE